MSDEHYYLAKGNGSKLLHVAKWRDKYGAMQVIKIPHRSWEFARERQWLKDEVAAQRLADAVLEPDWSAFDKMVVESFSERMDRLKVKLFSNGSIGMITGFKFYSTKPPTQWRWQWR